MSIAKGLLRSLFKNSLSALLLACLCLSVIAGCSGPLKVNYKATDKGRGMAPAEASSLFISPLKDGRSADELTKPHEIGRIEATVLDINGNRLIIADDPSKLVAGALAAEFASAGYDVKTDAAGADFVLEGEIKEFRLDIADRDRVAIEVNAAVKDRATGATIWSGAATERSDRYAGVMGNSKASIEKYLNASLAKVATSIVDGATKEITASRSGSSPAMETALISPQPSPIAPGTMSIRTVPARAKVYIGGVYYGLTPLAIELAPGVYELEIRQKGYRDGKEKVSVRKGETTELEMELEGED